MRRNVLFPFKIMTLFLLFSTSLCYAEESQQDTELPPTVITCDGALDVDFSGNTAVFRDNVAVKDQRGEVYADIMKVFFKQETREISLIEAEGNVIIYVDDKVAKSDRATYEVQEGTLALTGNPRIHEDKNVYAAEKITIFRKDGKTEMKLEPNARLLLYRDNTGTDDLFF